MLWSAAIQYGYSAPIWMTFRQSAELGAHVRKGESGTLVVYADKMIRKDLDKETGEEADRAIPFMKGYTVNVEQIEGLPGQYYGKPPQPIEAVQRISRADAFFAAAGASIIHGGNRACYVPATDAIHMPRIEFLKMRSAITRRSPTNAHTGPVTRRALTATSGARGSVMRGTRWKSLWPSSEPRSFAPIWSSFLRCATITPPISRPGSMC